MTRVVVQGRAAFARLLRFLADQVESGELLGPPSVSPAPHLGEFAVRVGGFDYDLDVGLPGITPDPADDD